MDSTLFKALQRDIFLHLQSKVYVEIENAASKEFASIHVDSHFVSDSISLTTETSDNILHYPRQFGLLQHRQGNRRHLNRYQNSPKVLERLNPADLYPKPNCMGDSFYHTQADSCLTKKEPTSGAFFPISPPETNCDATHNLEVPCSVCTSEASREYSEQCGKYDTEAEQDTGYSSHSTCSSCNCDSSQVEQELQADSQQQDWLDPEQCLHGKNEIDDLIYHFDKFFRGQIDAKMQHMQNFIHTILTEQQIHVRHIVNTAVTCGQNSTDEDASCCSPARKVKRWSTDQEDTNQDLSSNTQSCVPGFASLKSPRTINSNDEVFTNNSLTCIPSSVNPPAVSSIDSAGDKIMATLQVSSNSKPSYDGAWKERALLQLTSTACAINTMLQRPEYRT